MGQHGQPPAVQQHSSTAAINIQHPRVGLKCSDRWPKRPGFTAIRYPPTNPFSSLAFPPAPSGTPTWTAKSRGGLALRHQRVYRCTHLALARLFAISACIAARQRLQVLASQHTYGTPAPAHPCHLGPGPQVDPNGLRNPFGPNMNLGGPMWTHETHTAHVASKVEPVDRQIKGGDWHFAISACIAA